MARIRLLAYAILDGTLIPIDRVAAEHLATAPARLATQDVEIGKVTALLAASLPHRRVKGTGEFNERRCTVSVLFVDIVGFTSMMERLDVTEVRILQRDFFAVVAQTVRLHGGHMEKYVGDAVLAVFGLHPSPDKGASQAVTAGLQLQAAVAQASLGGREQVKVRVAVATGDVIVDAATGQTGSIGLISGSVISLAARIQAYTEPALLSESALLPHHATSEVTAAMPVGLGSLLPENDGRVPSRRRRLASTPPPTKIEMIALLHRRSPNGPAPTTLPDALRIQPNHDHVHGFAEISAKWQGLRAAKSASPRAKDSPTKIAEIGNCPLPWSDYASPHPASA